MQAGHGGGVWDVGVISPTAGRRRGVEDDARSVRQRHVLVAGRIDDGVDGVEVSGEGLELGLALEVPDDDVGGLAGGGEVAAALAERERGDGEGVVVAVVAGDATEELAGGLQEVRAAVGAAARERAVRGTPLDRAHVASERGGGQVLGVLRGEAERGGASGWSVGVPRDERTRSTRGRANLRVGAPDFDLGAVGGGQKLDHRDGTLTREAGVVGCDDAGPGREPRQASSFEIDARVIGASSTPKFSVDGSGLVVVYRPGKSQKFVAALATNARQLGRAEPQGGRAEA